MKFLEIVGNASTTAWRNGRRLGHDVNCCAYTEKDDSVKVLVESNGSPVRGVAAKQFETMEAYQGWKLGICSNPRRLFIDALEQFDLETAWSDSSENFEEENL